MTETEGKRHEEGKRDGKRKQEKDRGKGRDRQTGKDEGKERWEEGKKKRERESGKPMIGRGVLTPLGGHGLSAWHLVTLSDAIMGAGRSGFPFNPKT